MKLLSLLFGQEKKSETKSEAEDKRELLISQGKKQFEKLKDLGLKIPVKLA
jgi:hypothetical protein